MGFASPREFVCMEPVAVTRQPELMVVRCASRKYYIYGHVGRRVNGHFKRAGEYKVCSKSCGGGPIDSTSAKCSKCGEILTDHLYNKLSLGTPPDFLENMKQAGLSEQEIFCLSNAFHRPPRGSFSVSYWINPIFKGETSDKRFTDIMRETFISILKCNGKPLS